MSRKMVISGWDVIGTVPTEEAQKLYQPSLVDLIDIVRHLKEQVENLDVIKAATHIKDKENPHDVNPEQIGAATDDHTHTPAEIGAADFEHSHTLVALGAAASGHTHLPEEAGAAPFNHGHDPVSIGASPINHTHTPEELHVSREDHTHTPEELHVSPDDHTHLDLKNQSGVGFRNNFEPGEVGLWEANGESIAPMTSEQFSGLQSMYFTSNRSGLTSSSASASAYIAIPEEVALVFAGKSIEVSVVAKSHPTASMTAPEFGVCYATNDVGNSGWATFNPGAEWQKFSFNYLVPFPSSNGGGQDILGIWGDTSGSGLGVIIDCVIISLSTIDPGAIPDYDNLEILNMVKAVDGPSSGLNADLFDNYDSDVFTKGISTTVITTQNWNTITEGGIYKVSNWSGSNGPSVSQIVQPPDVFGNVPAYGYGILVVNRISDSDINHTYITNNGNGTFVRNFYSGSWKAWDRVWTSSSGGKDSGLNADMLRGKVPGDFSEHNHTHDLDDLSAAVDDLLRLVSLPIGFQSMWPGAVAPDGWLERNGAELSRTEFSELFEVIGTRYGAGDGSTTFNLPDVRGEFERGWDNGRGVDSGRELGNWQDSTNKSHSHTATSSSNGSHGHSGSTYSGGGHSHKLTCGGVGLTDGGYSFGIGEGIYARPNMPAPSGISGGSSGSRDVSGVTYVSGHTHSISINNAPSHSHSVNVNDDGGPESRPRNIAFMPIIKAKNIIGSDAQVVGGNADTVDGLHASAFALAQHVHDDRYLLKDGTAVNSARLEGAVPRIDATPSTIPVRDENGDLYANYFKGTATAALWGDLAERYSCPVTEPGTVVEVSRDEKWDVEPITEDGTDRVYGVISTTPGYILNCQLEDGVDIALVGRVPVKVKGVVTKGDFLVGLKGGYARVFDKLVDDRSAIFAIANTSSYVDINTIECFIYKH